MYKFLHRRTSLGIWLFVGLLVALIGISVLTPGASASGASTCRLQEATSHNRSPEMPELEHVLVHGGDIESELERDFGRQYAGAWFEVEQAQFDVGLAPGPMSLDEATQELHEVLAAEVEPAELPYAEAHAEARSVPYSAARLDADLAKIVPELEATVPSEVWIVGTTVGEFAEPDSPGFWPQIQATAFQNATESQCETMLALLAPYGSEVSLLHEPRGPIVARTGIEPRLPGIEPIGGSEPPQTPPADGNANGLSPATSPLTQQDRLAIARSLESLLVKLGRPVRTSQMRMTRGRYTVGLTMPIGGRVSLNVFRKQGRGAKALVASGTATVAGAGAHSSLSVRVTRLGKKLLAAPHGSQVRAEAMYITGGGDVAASRLLRLAPADY